MIEARTGLLPTRAAVWDKIKAEFADKGNAFMAEVIDVWGTSLAEDAFAVSLIPEWIEVSNALWPNLQAAIVGEKTSQQALDDAQAAAVEILKDSGRI
jgi:multiple sugar transport system substrate-binding protein